MTAIARGLYGQAEVIHALMLRETRTRFGRNQLGYLWALLEPTLLILTFYVLFRVGGRVPPYGMDLVGFIGTGIVPYFLFANTARRVAESINGNKGLLFYPRVHVLDVVFARVLLEAVTYAWVFIALLGANALYRQELHVHDPMLVVAGLSLAALLGGALGLVFCGLGQLSTAVDRARGPAMRPLFWISGIFFAVEALPHGARDALLYNPVLHSIEITRGGWFPSYTATHADGVFTLLWVLGLLLLGLVLERYVRRRIEVT